ncbi:hypothetical protein PBI_SCTP2_503 [Salicola phage SCTP-2]|nr:hypothetical protein PBI_SCTP2_503 [Salicola phage SCTP-2]
MNLNESLSATVFHYTSLNQAYTIIKNDEFKLVPTIKNDSEIEQGSSKFYFLSLTRSRTGAYHKDKPVGVLFKLNGEKLNNNYKGKALDYWGDSTIGDDEMEDRLFTDDPSIPSLKYIEEITIKISSKSIYSKQLYYVIPVVTLAKKNNIPVYVYEDSSDFISNNKKDALSLQQIKELTKDSEKPFISSRMPSRDIIRDLESLVELWYKKDTSELTDRTRKKLPNILSRSMDFANSTRNDIHNFSGEIKNDTRESRILNRVIDIMKKNNFKVVDQMIDAVVEKWKKIRDQEYRQDMMSNETAMKQFSHILNVLDGKEGFDPQKMGWEEGDPLDLEKRLTNVLMRMYNYDIYVDEIQEYFPEFSSENQGHIVKVGEQIAKRILYGD